MKIHLLFLIGLFALGLGFGWMMRPGSKRSHRQDTMFSAADGSRESQHRSAPSRNNTQGIHDLVPDAITQITSSAGYFGYSDSDREMLIDALAEWYMESPVDALAWVKESSPYPKLVNQLLGELIIGVATADFHKGLELAKSEIDTLQRARADTSLGLFHSGAKAEPVSALFRLSFSHGTEAVLQVADLGVGGAYGSAFPYCKFPEGFDFHATLNGLADLNATLEEGKNLNVLPANLLSEWTKQDPEAAWKWLQEGREVRRNDTKLEYFRGYRDLVGNYELGETVGDYMGFDNDGIQGLMGLLGSQTISAEMVQGYVWAADPAERIGVVADLIRQSGNVANEWGDRLRTAMLSNLEPATRLSALEQALGDLDSSERAGMRPILLKLGHTEEELGHLYQRIGK